MLSKSKVIAYRQCPKRLWLSKHRPELVSISAATEASFAVGHAVGDVSQRLYGPGQLMFDGKKPDFNAAIRDTEAAVAKNKGVLFEAAFRADSTLVLADVVKLSAKGAHVIEVKSSTKVKDYHLEDCATQTHVMRKAGMKVHRIELAHIDSSFVYPGNEDYRGLLRAVDVAEEVEPLILQAPVWIQGALKTLAGDEPDIAPGKQCTTPFECPFYSHCNKPTTDYPVENMPKLSRKSAETLLARGIKDIRDMPASELKTDEQSRIYKAVKSGKPLLDNEASAPLKALGYPRFYLDYETIGFAVPIWSGTRPYQAIPFQWSLHIETAPGTFEQQAFLDLSGSNPARACTEALLKALGKNGSIVVYTGYEKTVLSSMARMLPDLETPIQAVIERLVDLHPITRAAYYHRDMQGSWSIKAVLPTIAPELRYDTLDGVQDGMQAQAAYLEAIHPSTKTDRKRTIQKNLLAYCKQDTLAMIAVSTHLMGAKR